MDSDVVATAEKLDERTQENLKNLEFDRAHILAKRDYDEYVRDAALVHEAVTEEAPWGGWKNLPIVQAVGRGRALDQSPNAKAARLEWEAWHLRELDNDRGTRS